jgi:hypothetical protein
VLALVLLAGFGSVLVHSEPRLTGTNSVPLRAPVVGLVPGEQLCQAAQLMPAHSARMRLFLAPVDTKTPPQTLVTIKQHDDGVIARKPGRYDDRGLIDVAFDPVRRTRLDAEVCVRNTGTHTVALSGINTPYGNAQIGEKKLASALTVLWFAAGKRSWFSELAAIAPRVGHARLGAGRAFWVAALLSVLAAGGALALVVRAARE